MNQRHTIKIHPWGKEFAVNDGTPLIDVLHEYGIEFPCGGKGTCGKCKVKVLDGTIEINDFHSAKIHALGLSEGWHLACLSNCTDDLTLEIDQPNHLILADESKFSFKPVDGFGVAIDLGTTTLVAQLVDLQTAEVIDVESRLNPQVKYGADLISRIQHAIDGHANDMTILIREELGSMLKGMLCRHPVEVRKITIVGNTAMQLIFSGDDVTPLSAFPFESDKLGEKIFQPNDLGWDFDVAEQIVFYPSIGSFVGSDILGGIYATGIWKKKSITALIDLGTNGEIVVGNQDQIVCASTAAGPAFEGANISMGMRAVTGAIASISWVENQMVASVIGNTQPKGICGSALIDAVALLRNNGLVDMFGLLSSASDKICVCEDVYLTQEDIFKFLLAKAAISAGLQMLANRFFVNVNEIEDIYIAGAFGTYLNIANVVKTGMIDAKHENIHKLGNTALIGAKMFLFSDIEVAHEILKRTTHVNLEREPHFQDVFVDSMMLL